jgi:hypothetical protein
MFLRPAENVAPSKPIDMNTDTTTPPTSSQNSSKPALRLAMIAWSVSALTAAGLILGAVRFSAATASDTPEIDAAISATASELKRNAGAPRDPDSLQVAAANLFVILNPELAQRELRKDSKFLAAETAATASFSGPGAVHASRMEDPEYRRNYTAAMESFSRDARNTDVPIEPSVTDASQIEALRNDPAWLRQREASLRQLAPPSQSAGGPTP